MIAVQVAHKHKIYIPRLKFFEFSIIYQKIFKTIICLMQSAVYQNLMIWRLNINKASGHILWRWWIYKGYRNAIFLFFSDDYVPPFNSNFAISRLIPDIYYEVPCFLNSLLNNKFFFYGSFLYDLHHIHHTSHHSLPEIQLHFY